MFPLRNLLFLLVIVLPSFSWNTNNLQVTKWVIMKGGSLRVDGSTNINKFNCEIANYSNPDTIKISKNPERSSINIAGDVKLNVQNFDCHNPVMTADLRKTLKAKQYPNLVIRFLSLNKYPNLSSKQDYVKGLVSIELAGVTRRFEVDYKFLSSREDVLDLIGTRKINFTDFNITPPRKIGGMIQTDNELSVMFALRVKVID
ncbi:YceI family protein [Desertivirga brevis]|uniref:YceI family protein n=1 Tax=Desertivirga brevis TaxID=2810310 RepID=UPI001A976C46|nr:YceI family protein [Pedobacter sp. SYSU D00873]